MNLSPEDRSQLIDRLVDTLAGPVEPPPLSEAMKRELDRRIADMDANPDDELSLEDVEAEVRAELRKCRGR